MSFPPIDDVYTHLPTMLRDLLLSPGESHHPLHSSRSAPSLHVSPPSTPSTSPPLKSRIRAPHSPKKSFSVTFSPSPPQERSFEVN
ncbi:MAG: hypothetical protein FJZ63_07600, partial [Chlamydiae bacterium]|nr:hypothetical protein [Chlamydiota bacterium]